MWLMIGVLWDVTLCGWVSHDVSNERIETSGITHAKQRHIPKDLIHPGFISPRRPDRVNCQSSLLSTGGRLPRDRKNDRVSILPNLRMRGSVIIIIIIIVIVIIWAH